jgi:hypothetical protein
MEWDDEKCLNLIEIYRNKPLLSDPKDRNYYKKHLKDDAWAEIGCDGFLFRILGPTRLIRYSKSVGFRRLKKFLSIRFIISP